MKFFFTLLLFIPLFSFTQNTLKKQLDSIETSDDAVQFLKTYQSDQAQLFIFNKEKHKTKLTDGLFKLPKGGKKVIKADLKKTYYKILDKIEVDHYRFNIIVIDAKNTSNAAAKSIRAKILSQYNEGYKFIDLAKHHSSGPNANTGGDTGWIKLGDISTTFDEIAFSPDYKVNDVFTIDDIKNKKYYIVVRTQDKKPIEEITVLKITEDI